MRGVPTHRRTTSVVEGGGAVRSVDRGACRPAIEPRKSQSGCRRRSDFGRRYGEARERECHTGPARSQTLACTDAPCAGTGRSSGRPSAVPAVRIGEVSPTVADDARPGEVRPAHSSIEAGERARVSGRGVGGAKGRGRGKHGSARHAPDPEPGKHVPPGWTVYGQRPS